MRKVTKANRKTEYLIFRVTRDLLRQIELAAEAEDRTASWWVRRACVESLKTHESVRATERQIA